MSIANDIAAETAAEHDDGIEDLVLVVVETYTTVYELDADDRETLEECGRDYFDQVGFDHEHVGAYADRHDGRPHDASRDVSIEAREDALLYTDWSPVAADGPTQRLQQAALAISQAQGCLGRARHREGDVDKVDNMMMHLMAVGEDLRIELNRMAGLDANARPLPEVTA